MEGTEIVRAYRVLYRDALAAIGAVICRPRSARGHGREFRAEHENGLRVLVLAAVDLKGRDIKLLIL